VQKSEKTLTRKNCKAEVFDFATFGKVIDIALAERLQDIYYRYLYVTERVYAERFKDYFCFVLGHSFFEIQSHYVA
jgi:hypothetical protein